MTRLIGYFSVFLAGFGVVMVLADYLLMKDQGLPLIP